MENIEFKEKINELNKLLFKTAAEWSCQNDNIKSIDIVKIIHYSLDQFLGSLILATSIDCDVTPEKLLKTHNEHVLYIIKQLKERGSNDG